MEQPPKPYDYNRPTIPLENAYLCCACDTVGNDARRCFSCSSQAIVSIARILSHPRSEA